MEEIVMNISKILDNSTIDIESLNYFLNKIEGNKKSISVRLTEQGNIVLDKSDKWFYEPWIEKIKKLKDYIFRILGLLSEGDKEIDNLCGIKNIGNNCYLNAGLQILARCYPLVVDILKKKYEENELVHLFIKAVIMILFRNGKFYNPTNFMKVFCQVNKEFIFGQQNCSQNFIRTLLRNINDAQKKNIFYENYYPSNQNEYIAYKNFVDENKIFPESKVYNQFSGMIKIEIIGECSNCKEKIKRFSFNSFLDQTIYLDGFYTKCRFSEVLRKNIGQKAKTTMKCFKCNEKVHLNIVKKFVKIPEIFIFTLERYIIRNKVVVEPEEIINIHDYVDDSLKMDKSECNYELFAVNIRIGEDLSFGHEICQVKENDQWYTIDDDKSYPTQRDFNEYSYGLFYRKISNN